MTSADQTRLYIAVQHRDADKGEPRVIASLTREPAAERFATWVSDYPERLTYLAEVDVPTELANAAPHNVARTLVAAGISHRDLTEYHPGDALRGDEEQREAERNSVPAQTYNALLPDVVVEAETGVEAPYVVVNIMRMGDPEGDPVVNMPLSPAEAIGLARKLLRRAEEAMQPKS